MMILAKEMWDWKEGYGMGSPHAKEGCDLKTTDDGCDVRSPTALV